MDVCWEGVSDALTDANKMRLWIVHRYFQDGGSSPADASRTIRGCLEDVAWMVHGCSMDDSRMHPWMFIG